jgi:hypothetical protein
MKRAELWHSYKILMLSVLLGLCTSAQAQICEARFFHNGGVIEIGGSGMLNVSAKLTFSQVKKTSGTVCQAQVNGFAKYALLSFLSGANDIDHVLSVNGNKTSIANARPGKAADTATFDVQLLGLFGFGEPIRAAGQKFAAQSYTLAVGDPKRGSTTPVGVRMGEKTVGAQQTIQTAVGKLQCWPVRYARSTDATTAQVQGLVLPIPSIPSQVTDWFCPSTNLVMKQEIEHSGQKSVVEVKVLR